MKKGWLIRCVAFILFILFTTNSLFSVVGAEGNGEIVTQTTDAPHTEDIILNGDSSNNTIIQNENLTSNISPMSITPETLYLSTLAVEADTYTDSYYNHVNYSTSIDLKVGTQCQTFLKFNFDSVPASAVLTNAFVEVSYYNSVTSGYLDIGIYKVNNAWDESSLNYIIASSFDMSSTAIDIERATASSSVASSNPGTLLFDITSVAKEWVYGISENNGVALKYESGTNSSVLLKSKELASGAYAAKLYVEYVVLEDGVYSLENVGNVGLYMDIQQNKTSPGYHVQQYAYSTSPEINFQRSGLFKITRIPGTGRYTIRLMLNNQLSFVISGNEVLTKQIESSDSEVSAEDTFYIDYEMRGFVIKPYGSTYAIAAKNTIASGASGAPDSYLTKLSTSNYSDRYTWEFRKYTGSVKYGCDSISSTGDFLAGKTNTLKSVTWSTVVGVNKVNMYVHSDCTDIATSIWNSSTCSMTMMIHDEGSIRVIVDICNDKTGNAIKSYNEYYDSSLPVEEGLYFFENKEEELYMQIDSQDSSNDYQSNFAKIQLKSLSSEADYQKWKVVHVLDGYYKIISHKSNHVISVPSGYLNSESYLIQEVYSGDDRQLWSFYYDTNNQAYVIISKSNQNPLTPWCVCAPNTGNYVIQSNYEDNNSYKDYWYIEQINEYYNLFIGNRKGDSSMEPIRDEVESLFDDYSIMNGVTYCFPSGVVETGYSKNNLIQNLKEVTIFSTITHGDETGIDLIDGEELIISDIMALSNQIDNLKLVYMGACSTAYVNPDTLGENNFAQAFINAGAGVVVGYTCPIYMDETEEWTKTFFKYLLEGYTVNHAIYYADSDHEFSECTAQNRSIKGEGNVIICPSY